MADIGKPIRRIRVEPERIRPARVHAPTPKREPTRRKEKVGRPR